MYHFILFDVLFNADKSKCIISRPCGVASSKVGRVASESVIMQLISSKCLPVLLYATEASPFLARDQSSVSFAVTRVLMKIFRTVDLGTLLISVKLCLVCCLLIIMCF